MKKRILVIDEHELVCAGVVAMLSEHADYAVHPNAVRVQNAMRQIATHAPDLVILDPWQQDTAQPGVLMALREKYPSLPVLVVTDNAGATDINRTLQYRVNGYMLKSSPAKDLIAAIETIFSGRTFMHPDVSHALITSDFDMAIGDRANNSTPLTIRQEQVLRMIADGKTTRQIASTLGLSAKTIESHRVMLMNRLGIHHIPGLVRYALRHGYAKFESANDA